MRGWSSAPATAGSPRSASTAGSREHPRAAREQAVGTDIPSAIEGAGYTTELVITNVSDVQRPVQVSFESSALALPGKSASLAMSLSAGEQVRYPNIIESFRSWIGTSSGATVAGRVFVFGLVEAVARTRRRAATGSYGVSYGGSPARAGYCSPFSESLWLLGLRQDGASRTNIALIGPPSDSSTARVDIYDGDTGRLAGSVRVALAQDEWRQLDSALAAYGVTNGYARVAIDGSNGGVTAYAVVNDGAAPGLGTGDGSFIVAEPAR